MCLSVILIDSVSKMGKKYFRQVFLEECKYVMKGKKMNKCVELKHTRGALLVDIFVFKSNFVIPFSLSCLGQHYDCSLKAANK